MLKNVMLIISFTLSVFAQSESAFPSDWKSYESVSTPLATIGALPDCNADVSSLPLIYQETVSTRQSRNTCHDYSLIQLVQKE